MLSEGTDARHGLDKSLVINICARAQVSNNNIDQGFGYLGVHYLLHQRAVGDALGEEALQLHLGLQCDGHLLV